MKLFIGLMSGTSMDGIDAALIDLRANKFIHGITQPYSPEVRKDLDKLLLNPVQSIGFCNQLHTRIGKEFANATLKLLHQTTYHSQDIIAIGSHGQTIGHDTTEIIPYTIQLGCPHTIAHATNIQVVADFRTRDLINGGQGAPFAPIYHQAIFANLPSPIAIANIGGIANLTYLKNSKEVKGYDVGPGNCLMDVWIKQHLSKNFDKNGEWAASGQVIPALLNELLKDDFFKKEEPKSIGKEYFSLEWLNPFLSSDYKPEDVQATLQQLTAILIADSIKKQNAPPQNVYICGGGVHNRTLLHSIQFLLPEFPVASTEKLGINPDYIEALMFAWLADKCLQNEAIDLTTITGSKKPAILGVIYPRSL